MILETFYVLFKNNSSDLIKGNKDAEKSTKQLGENLKNTGEDATKLGEQYVKMVEGATAALTGLVSFRAIASGLFKASDINSDLQLQSNLLGQNVVSLKAYGAAVETLGGNAADFRSNIQGIFEDISSKGGRLPAIDTIIEKFRTVLKTAGGDVSQQQFLFGKLGISSQSLKSLILLPDKEYTDVIAKQKELAANTEEGAKVAREFQKTWSDVGHSLDSVFTVVGTDVLPTFQDFSSLLIRFFDYLKDNKGLAEGFFITAASGVTILSAAIVSSLIPALGGLVAASGGVAAVLAPLAALADVGVRGHNSLLGQGARKIAALLDAKIYEDEGMLTDGPSKKDSFRITSEAIGANESAIMAQQRMLRNVGRVKTSLLDADSTQFGLLGNTTSNNSKSINVKIDNINVQTDASNSSEISQGISNNLLSHIRATMANLDDGVAK